MSDELQTLGQFQNIMAAIARTLLAGQPNVQATGAGQIVPSTEQAAQSTLAQARQKQLEEEAEEEEGLLGELGPVGDVLGTALDVASVVPSPVQPVAAGVNAGVKTADAASQGNIPGAVTAGVGGALGAADAFGAAGADAAVPPGPPPTNIATADPALAQGAVNKLANAPIPGQGGAEFGGATGAAGFVPGAATAVPTPPAAAPAPAVAGAAPPPPGAAPAPATPTAPGRVDVDENSALAQVIRDGGAGTGGGVRRAFSNITDFLQEEQVQNILNSIFGGTERSPFDVPAVFTPGLDPELALAIDNQFLEQRQAEQEAKESEQRIQLEGQRGEREERRIGLEEEFGRAGLDLDRERLAQSRDFGDRKLAISERMAELDESQFDFNKDQALVGNLFEFANLSLRKSALDNQVRLTDAQIANYNRGAAKTISDASINGLTKKQAETALSLRGEIWGSVFKETNSIDEANRAADAATEAMMAVNPNSITLPDGTIARRAGAAQVPGQGVAQPTGGGLTEEDIAATAATAGAGPAAQPRTEFSTELQVPPTEEETLQQSLQDQEAFERARPAAEQFLQESQGRLGRVTEREFRNLSPEVKAAVRELRRRNQLQGTDFGPPTPRTRRPVSGIANRGR